MYSICKLNRIFHAALRNWPRMDVVMSQIDGGQKKDRKKKHAVRITNEEMK